MDDTGRLFDEFNNVISGKGDQQTGNKFKPKKIEKIEGNKFELKAVNDKRSAFYDPSLESSKNKREKKKMASFIFKEKGSSQKNEVKQRKKEAISSLEDQQALLNKSITSVMSQTSALDKIGLKPPDPIPDVEWWDAPFVDLGQDTYSIKTDKITEFVQYPLPVTNDYNDKLREMPEPLLLTKPEIKKLVKAKRQEKVKEKHMNMQLGLIEQPPVKIKLSNWVNVLGKEALADPTRVERRVREIVEKRQQDHQEQNANRKLTKEGRHQKFKRKIKRDLARGVKVSVFRIAHLHTKALRFKIEKNAIQLMLKGFCIIPQKASNLPVVLVVEGGPWAISKYKKLCLRRIKWKTNVTNEETQEANPSDHSSQEEQKKEQKPNGEQEVDTQVENQNKLLEEIEKKEDDEEEEEKEENSCMLVWEGIVKKKQFDRWRVIQIKNESEGRRVLMEKGVEHYWTLASQISPDRADTDKLEMLLR